MTTYSVNSLEHQAVRSFLRRQSEKARRRRRCEDMLSWAAVFVTINGIVYFLLGGLLR